MSTLLLARHAQASFFDKDYDKLSPLGKVQSRRLGTYLAERGQIFDEVFTGPARRHKQTAQLVAESYAQSDLQLPEPVVIDEWNEHAAHTLLMHPLDSLADANPALRQYSEKLRQSNGRDEILKNFQRLFEVVIDSWVSGAFAPAGIESFETFCDRVRTGLDRVRNSGGHNRRVLVFTSSGPICVSLQQALETDDHKSFQLGWRVQNSSLSQFLFTEGRFTLDMFNSIPHLDEAMRTYL